MKFFWVLVAVAALATGCGDSESTVIAARDLSAPEEIREAVVALDGKENPENVGLVVAAGAGCFQEEGLEVQTLSPVSLGRSIGAVVDGSDAFGVAHQPEVVMAAARGAPIVVVGSLVSQPTAAMIWLKSENMRKISDLRGKTIAIPGLSFQESFLQSYLARGGVALDEVKVVRVENELVSALVNGLADAIFGGSWNVEGVDLKTRGLEPVVTRVAPFLGLPAYDELVLIVRADRVEDPELIRDFLSALACGAEAAVRDPSAIEPMIEIAVEWDLEPSQRATRSALAATLPLLSQDARPDPDETLALAEWMQDEGIVRQAPAPSTLIADDYLPRP